MGRPAKQERRGGIETLSNTCINSCTFQSRNAVVALKRHTHSAETAETVRKQERRGGIETAFSDFLDASSERKQERRGGIETEADWTAAAVDYRKQKRRGGIETEIRVGDDIEVHGSRNAVVALKQRGLATIWALIGVSRNAVVALKPDRARPWGPRMA